MQSIEVHSGYGEKFFKEDLVKGFRLAPIFNR